jgi:hypothetical protein
VWDATEAFGPTMQLAVNLVQEALCQPPPQTITCLFVG